MTLAERQAGVSVVEYHKGVLDPETGWMVTPQEAYLPEEWAEHATKCPGCGDEFVVYTSGDVTNIGRPSGYCSIECKQEAHRRDAREWARRNRAKGN